MPGLYQITANFFLGVINRLGVRPPPPEAFLLSNVVTPVTIVDTDIAIPAFNTTPALGAPFTQGPIAAPAAGTLLADTGAQLASGTITVTIFGAAALEPSGTTVLIQRRNAANAANIWETAANIGIQGGNFPFSLQVPILLNERLRVVQGPQNGGVASTYQVTIFQS